MQYNTILAEQKFAPYNGDGDTYGGIFQEVTRCESLQDIWIIGLLPCDERWLKEARSNSLVGNTCGVHGYTPQLLGVLAYESEDSGTQGSEV